MEVSASARGVAAPTLEVSRYRGPVASGVGSAGERHRAREGLLVRLSWGPHLGLGEASPLPGRSRDSLTQAECDLASLDLEPLLDNSDDLRRLDVHLDNLRLSSPAARFALETAVLDVTAQRRNEPLHCLLGAGRRPSKLALAALIPAADPSEACRLARSLVERGYRTLKLKVGVDVDTDVRVVRALRREVGEGVELRLDANRSYSASAAVEALKGMAVARVAFVEEPCPTREIERFLGRCDVPIGVDESLDELPPTALSDLLAGGRVAALVLKPAALGGFWECVRLARQASRHGVPTVVSHLFDGPVGLAAASELALGLGPCSVAHGLAPHAALVACRPLSGCRYAGRAGACLVPHARAGLGLELPRGWGRT